MILKDIHFIDDSQNAMGTITVDDGIIRDVEITDEVPDIAKPVLLPAFTDLHAHFRDPGYTYKEDVSSGCHAAVRGGYTSVNLMPNTMPVCNSLKQAKDVMSRIQAIGLIDANQTISMTKDELGLDCSHLHAIPKEAVPFVSDDGKGVNREDIMKQIFEICRDKHFLIMAHEEDARYVPDDMRMSENAMTFRDIQLCEETDGSIHFCHVSTREAVQAIREAKGKGLRVSCEVTPHHLFFDAEQAQHYRVAPPFRTPDDVNALIQAIKDGTVDTISTDHAPHTLEDKRKGANGISGIETAFALCYTRLVRKGHISLNQLVKLMATTPAAIMHLNKGRIRKGMQADFVIVDLQHPYTINASEFVSKGKNTPFDGVEVYGKILYTFFKGNMVYNTEL